MPRGARGMRSAFRAAAGVHRLPCGWDWFDAARRATLCSRPGSSVLPDVLRCSSKQGSLRGGEWPSAEHHLLAHAPMAFDPIATTASTLPDTSAAFFSHAPSPCLAKPALYDFHTDFHSNCTQCTVSRKHRRLLVSKPFTFRCSLAPPVSKPGSKPTRSPN